jgi:hypothetical protein
MPSAVSYSWKVNDLHYGKGSKPVISIEKDAKYPTMWRVRMPDGTLSDMVNRTRAKDAAILVADRILNVAYRRDAPGPVRLNEGALGRVPEKV